jgi:ABC-type polar amino acid transport system ATPase subunit
MISIHGLHKRFGERVVLNGIDATIERGSVVALIGASGSGKTTLLRCLNGLEPFDAGSVCIAGHDLGPRLACPRLERLRSDVGMVFQDYQLFPHLSALDNVTLAPRVVQKLGAREAERLGRHWLDRVGLAERAAARPSELSGGQQQRVALARTLAQGVRVLLLDEPTSALDVDLRDSVRRLLSELVRAAPGQEALTLIMVTHDRILARELASELWVLERGSLAERGDPARLLSVAEGRIAREALVEPLTH